PRSCSRGAPACEVGPPEPPMNLYIHTTTGTRYELSVPAEETVEGLKRRLSQRLKVPKERGGLALLHKESRLSSGKLQDLGVVEGSKLTLVPTVEAGLMSQASRPEQSVMQALESLTETQVNDFLSGRSPLTLALRVGEAPHAAPVTAGMFRSHGASTQTVNSSVVSSCSEVDCGSRSSSSPGSSPAPSARSRKPGAVIESFVNHAPGVFSGTFSGTLHPNCQDSSGRPRRDIGTILQILNDLLSATRHYQGMPQSLTQLRCQTQFSSSSSSSSSSSPPASPDLATKTTSEPLPAAAAPTLHPVVQCQSQIRMCKPSGDRLRQTENRATRCKVERLQLLLQQKRLRRKARRDARAPYHWVPNRKAGRTNSNSSVSSEGSLDLDFEDSVWKPEVKAEMKSEFVVA
ncbi:PREDICTED: LOW QUALITY PROTEIN: midnolin, partial [Ficedula albicollis]|uniref:LOW QUALITY PROTEIN: midnolin n=1 Tax=Ficedula albicollis TaxID=59894 RepID=UPI0007AD788B